MKNNIFQKTLFNILMVSVILTMNSVSAMSNSYDCSVEEFVGRCGIFGEDDVQALREPLPLSAQHAYQAFDDILSKRWERQFECLVQEYWYFWSDEQKEMVIKRMAKQGLLTNSQVKNWRKMQYPPCVKIGG